MSALRLACLALILGACTAAAAPVACTPGQALLSTADGQPIATFSVEIADDARERETGLMNRPSMARGAGMLFVYPSERLMSFWMRNTLIPLDMLFIDAAGRVVSVHSDAVPLDETPIPSGVPAQFVLEINGGLADRMGLGPGAILSHPAVNRTGAAIPCR